MLKLVSHSDAFHGIALLAECDESVGDEESRQQITVGVPRLFPVLKTQQVTQEGV